MPGKRASAKSSTPALLVVLMAAIGLAGFARLNAELIQRSLRSSSGSLSSAGAQFVPAPATVRLIALGFDQLVADFYWLKFIGYYGDSQARSKDNYALAHQYLELITGLDPYFVQPYWFAAFAVGAEEKRPVLAEKIISRGIEANQNNWYLPYIAGINMYLFAHDDAAAARYYRMAAKFPEAPPWLTRQAEVISAHIPAVIKELQTWDSIYRAEQSSLVKEHARARLIELWTRVYHSTEAPGVKARAQAALSEFGVTP